MIIGLTVSKDNRLCAWRVSGWWDSACCDCADQFWSDSPFHIFCRCRPMVELVRCVNDHFVVGPSESQKTSSTRFGTTRWPSRHHALSHIPRSAVDVSHDVVLMLQVFISHLHTSLKRSIGLEPIFNSLLRMSFWIRPPQATLAGSVCQLEHFCIEV